MNNQQQEQEQLISLRDYLNVIIKRKKIILTIFFVSVISAAVISSLEPKVYRATTLIMITAYNLPTVLSTTTISEEIISLTIPTHVELLKSSVVLQRIIERIALHNSLYKNLTPDEIYGKLNVSGIKETTTLQLKAEDRNPKTAKELVNTWAEEYVKYIREFISELAKGTDDFITYQFNITKQNLIQAEEAIKELKGKYKLDLMRAELDIKMKKLNNYKSEIIDLKSSLKTNEDNLLNLKNEIAKQDKFIIVSKAITDDALWQKVSRSKDTSNLEKIKLRSEEVNPIYQNLEIRIVNTEIEINTLKPRQEYLNALIVSIEKEVSELEKDIEQKEFELTQLSRNIQIFKRTYDNLAIWLEKVRIAKVLQFGEAKIISYAFEPKYPIKPQKRNITIAAIASLAFAMFLAFFMEFWKPQLSEKIKD